MSSKNLVIACLITFISALLYKIAASDVDIVEQFWPTSGNTLTAVVNTQNPRGFSVYKNNQNQLCADPNQLVNTNLLSSNDQEFLQNSLSPASSPQYKDYLTQLKDPKGISFQSNEPYCGSCSYNDDKNVPVSYTVPGTYQPPLSPRFNPTGLEGNIRYQLPAEQNMASEPNNPLMVADRVAKQEVRENFHADGKFNGNTPKEFDQKYYQLQKDGSAAFNQLPVGAMGAGPEENNEFFYNTNRLTFALNKNRLTGLGDFIRGDLPVVACNPDANPYSNVWFRPSARASQLLAGATNVIAGVGNVTAQQLSELQMRDVGSVNTTFGGVPLVAQQRTPVGDAIDYQQVKLNNIDPGNSINLQAQSASPALGNNTVQATAFP